MSKENNEITLGQLFGVVKKSFKLGLIYVLVAVIAAAAVLFTAKALTSINVYTTSISLAEADKNALSVMNAQKNIVVNKATGELDGKLADSLTENLSVSAVVPSELSSTEEFIPTSFVISLKQISDEKLTSGQYNNILDKIAAEYLNLFAANEFPLLEVDYNVDNSLKTLEYIQVADELSDKISLAYQTLSSYVSSNASIGKYRDTKGNSVSDTVGAFETIANSIENIKVYIISRGAEINDGGLASYLITAKKKAEAEVTKYNELLVAATDALTNFYGSGTPTPVSGTIIISQSDSAQYITLANRVNEYAILKSNASFKAAQFDSYLAIVPSGTADKAALKTQLTDFAAQADETLKLYRSLVEEYNENMYLTSQATINNPSHANVETFISLSVMIIALVAVALVAYVVAFGKTFGKLRNEGYFSESQQEEKE